MVAPGTPCDRRTFLAGLTGTALALSLRADDAPPVLLPAAQEDRAALALDPGLCYLNFAALGAVPQVVLQATQADWQRLERDPAGLGYGALPAECNAALNRAAGYLGCAEGELAFTANTTEGMTQVALGAGLQHGDQVLLSDHEHPGGRQGWDYLARHGGVQLATFALPLDGDPGAILAAAQAALTPRTRIISVSHVTYTTGVRLPLAELARLAAAHDALLVADGAQAAGAIPVRLSELGCAAWATSGHKWLAGPKGTGLLYLSRAARERLHPPLLAGGMGSYTGATGMRNLPALIGLGLAMNLMLHETDVAFARQWALREHLQAAVANDPRLRWLSPRPEAWGAPLATIGWDGNAAPGKVAEALLNDHRVSVRAISHGAVRGIRLSLHRSVGTEQLDYALAALRRVLAALP